MIKKYLLIIDSILILGSLLTIFFMVGYTQPLVISGFNDESIRLFVLDQIDYLEIDSDLSFESPKTVFIDDGSILELEEGKYYFKKTSGISSEILKITLEVPVRLQFHRLLDGQVEVLNIGGSKIRVNSYEQGYLVNSSLGSGVNLKSVSFERGTNE